MITRSRGPDEVAADPIEAKMSASESMTTRERLLGALQKQDVDHIPCCINFNPLDRAARRGHDWNFPWAEDATNEQRLAYQVEELGLDQVVGVSVDLCSALPDVNWMSHLEGDILHNFYDTAKGQLHAAVRYNDLWPHGERIPFYSDFNVGHFVEPWIQNAADLACFQQIRHLDDSAAKLASARDVVDAAQGLAQRYRLPTHAAVGMGLTGAQHLFGVADLCMLTVDEPGLVEAYLDYEHQINLRTLEVLGELGVDMVRRNGFYETADFYSPAMLEQFLGDRLRREADMARQAGMHMSYTVHTGVGPIVEFLASLGMGSLFGIDPVAQGMRIDDLRRDLLPTTGLWMGPSSTYHVWEGPAATRQAVRDVFACFADCGFVLSPAVSVHSIMPWESSLAMIDEWKKLR